MEARRKELAANKRECERIDANLFGLKQELTTHSLRSVQALDTEETKVTEKNLTIRCNSKSLRTDKISNNGTAEDAKGARIENPV